MNIRIRWTLGLQNKEEKTNNEAQRKWKENMSSSIRFIVFGDHNLYI